MEQSNGSEGICVGVRMRPLNGREIQDGQGRIYKCNTTNNEIYHCNRDGSPADSHRFNYDKVFDEKSGTADVYSHVGQKIVSGVVSGINGTIFAYGQTSSGKTHTMIGSDDQMGILEMAAGDIFNQIAETTDRKFGMKVSFVEIYNDDIRDLLAEGKNKMDKIKIKEDPVRGVYIDTTEVPIGDFDTIMNSVKKGLKNRTVESTQMNEASSRSHSIFRLVLESVSEDGSKRISALNLVDLAGSESVKHTGAKGARQVEGGKINQSLLSLSLVISALAENRPYINYRDSSLTRLLQPSLSGNAKMSIVCCITAAEKYFEETKSTLQFASRAKLVKTNAQVNDVPPEDSVLVKRYAKEIEELKQKQAEIEIAMKAGGGNDEELNRIIAEKNAEIAARDAKLNELNEKILAAAANPVVCAPTTFLDLETLNRTVKLSKLKPDKRGTWCPGSNSSSISDEFHAPLTLSSVRSMGNFNKNNHHSSSSDVSGNDRSSLSSDCSTVPESEHGADFDAEKHNLLSELATKDEQIRALESRLYSLENNYETGKADISQDELAMLKETLSLTQDRLQEFEASAEQLLAQNAAAAQQLEMEAEIQQGLEEQNAALVNELAASKDQIAALETELEQANASTLVFGREFELMAEKAAVASDLEKATLEVAALKEELTALQQKVEEEAESTAETMKFLEEKTASLESEIDSQQAEIARLEASLQAATTQQDSEEMVSLRETVTALETELSAAASKISDMTTESEIRAIATENELLAAVSSADALQAELDTVCEDAISLQEEVQALAEQISVLETEKATTNILLDAARVDFVVAKEASDQEAAKSAETIASLEMAVAEKDAQLSELTAELHLTRSEESNELEHLRVINGTLQTELRSKEELVSSLESEAAEMGEELESDKEQLIAAETRIGDLEASVHASLTRCSELEGMVAEKVDQLCDAEGRVVELEALVHAAETRCAEVELSLVEKDEQINSLEGRLEVLQNSGEGQTEFVKASEARIFELESKNSSVESRCSELEAVVSEQSALVSQFEARVSELEGEKVQLTENNNAALSAFQELEVTKTELEAQITIMAGEMSDLTTSLETAITEQQLAEEELCAAKDTVSELEKKVVELESNMAVLNESACETSVVSGELEQLQVKCADLESQVQEAASYLNDAESRYSSAVEEVHTLQSANQEYVATISILQTEAETLKQTIASQIDSLAVETELRRVTENSLEETSVELNRVQAAHSDEVSALTEDVVLLKEQGLAVEIKLDDVIGQLKQERVRVLQLISEVATANGERDNAVAAVQSATDDISRLATDNGELQSRVAALVASVNAAESKVTAMAAAQQSKPVAASLGAINETEVTQVGLDAARRDMERQIETMRSELGNKEAEVSKLRASVTEFQERAQRAEHNLSQYSERESLSAGGDEAMRKKIGQLQTTVDLLKSERDVLSVKISESEQENRSRNGHDAFYTEQLERKLNDQTKLLEKLQSEKGDVCRMKDSIAALEKRLGEMKAERDEAKQFSDAAQAKVREMETEVQQNHQEILRLSQLENSNVLTELQQELQFAAQREADIQAAKEQVEVDLRESALRLKKAKEESAMLHCELAANEKTIDKLTKDCDLMSAELEKALEQVQDLTTALEEAESLTMGGDSNLAEHCELIASLETLKAAEMEYKRQIDTLTTEMVDAQSHIETADNTLSELNITLLESQGECGMLTEQVALLQEEADQTNKRLAALQNDFDQLISAKNVLEQQLNEKDAVESNESVEEIQCLTEKVTTLEQTNAELEAQLSETMQELSDAQASNEEQCTALSEQVTLLEQINNELTAELDETRVSLSSVEGQVLSLSAEMGALQKTNADLVADAQRLRDNSASSEQVDSLTAELGILSQQNAELAAQVDELLAAESNANDRVSSLEEQIAANESVISILKTETQILNSEMSAMSERVAAMESSEGDLQSEVAKLRTTVVEQEDIIAELENELTVTKQQAESAETAAMADLEQKVQDITDKNEALIAKLHKATNELQSTKGVIESHEDKVFALQTEIAEKDKRIERLDHAKLTKDQMERIQKIKEENKVVKEKYATLKGDMKMMTARYEKLKEVSAANAKKEAVGGPSNEYIVSDLKFKIADLNEQLERERTKTSKLTDKLRECSTQLQEYERERADVLAILEKNGVDTVGLVSLDTSLTSDASSLEAQVELGLAVSKLAEKLVAAQSVASHKESSKSQKVMALEEKLANTASELEDFRAQKLALEKRVEQFRSKDKASREEVSELTVQVETLTAQIASVRAELSAAESKVVLSSDNVSSEIQVLQEENIELMQENKALRLDITRLRSAAPAPAASTISAEQKRTFGTLLSPQKVQSRDNAATPAATTVVDLAAKTQSSVGAKRPAEEMKLSALITGEENPQSVSQNKRRNATKAAPLVQDSGENPECTQS